MAFPDSILRRLPLLIALGLLLPATAFSQSGRITGIVLDAASGSLLPASSITVEGTSLGTATATDGTFLIDRVPMGMQILVVSRVGYASASRIIDLAPDQTTDITVRLTEEAVSFPEVIVEQASMTGGLAGIADIAGSAHYISPRALQQFGYNDVNRVLRSVPGISLQEEDGYGLRPNIGIRGTGSERSSKITVMEDGVLMAPAPYAAPAAYYFPTVGRMHGVEVRKGSSQIRYGPYTTGGAINMLSTPVPSSRTGHAQLLLGNDENRLVHLYGGNSYKHVSWLVETYQSRSDGFKQLDGGGNTGFDKADYLAKLRFATAPDARVFQSLTLKAAATDETSNETYLGLTDHDFQLTPLRRYAGSAADQMTSDQRQFVARHVVRPASSFEIVSTAYHTRFNRNWYKLYKVAAGGSSISIGDLLDDPTNNPIAFSVVTGSPSMTDHSLSVKANNRAYQTWGAQADVGYDVREGIRLDVGVRVHRDEMDRFQWVDQYRMTDSVMSLNEAGTPGTDSNRIERADAVAAFLQPRLEFGRLVLTPGLRFEHIVQTRDDYGKADPTRTGVDLKSRRNTADVLIPGIGAAYSVTDYATAFVGLHKGFSPPGTTIGALPEESTNYELGARYERRASRLEVVGFVSDYRNLLGSDLAAAGGTGSTDLFNGGRAAVHGTELSGAHNLGGLIGWRASLPVTFSYTWTEASFGHSFESNFEGWGSVTEGDHLPYLPVHQWAISTGIETGRYDFNVSGAWMGEMRTRAGSGSTLPTERIDGHFVLDVAANIEMNRWVNVFASVRNITDAVYVVARRPAGLRPGLPRSFVMGLRANL